MLAIGYTNVLYLTSYLKKKLHYGKALTPYLKQDTKLKLISKPDDTYLKINSS